MTDSIPYTQEEVALKWEEAEDLLLGGIPKLAVVSSSLFEPGKICSLPLRGDSGKSMFLLR
jgi:hypothetical protein